MTPVLKPGDLRAIPYLRELAEPALARFAAKVSIRQYEPGESVIHEGDPCGGLFYVQMGRVRIFKTSIEGKEQVLHYIGAGGTFNDVPVFDGGPNPANVSALEPAALVHVRREDLLDLIATEPVVAHTVIRILAARLRHLVGLVEDLSFRHVTNRVAKILLTHFSRPDAPRITQQEMAAMAGTAREMVGRALKGLEQDGVIQIDRGRVVILDRKKLEQLV
ncbi:MAG: Crp/Fnr family transcriptional regulator [Chloroflexi bacterium]|nr:Crp/Fnr family transcriptional regulator [Chloroflexota bacterium]